MTPFHDTPAPTPTYSYYPSHHAHLPRISSSAPIKFAPYSHFVSIKVVSCSCHRRSSAISFLLRPFLQTKSFISSSYFTPVNGFFSPARCISCTIRAVVFVLSVLIPPTLPSDFSYYSLRRPGPLFSFLFLVVREVALVTFSGNNASLYFGVGVLFPFGLICVFN